MGMTFETDQDLENDFGALFADDGSDLGWHIRFRLAPGVRTVSIDPRAMLRALAAMGVCQIIGRDATAADDAVQQPIGWDMVLVGNTTRAAIEHVFVGMPDAMELEIQQIH